MVRQVKQKPMNWVERLYVFEALRGLFTTLKHALRGLLRYETLPTVPYPEMKPEIPRNYRARHRLMLRPDGTPRCVACGMCAAACPAHCIYIEAAETEDPRIEKAPARFDIDHLVCVFCGLCVEACPVDALRMDTCETSYVHPKRDDFVAPMFDLMTWDPKTYPQNDTQSQMAPGGTLNQQALDAWGMKVN
ncbi:MAG: NADH-quinone oxidoreductase subunit I [Fibrobacteraceae bacterium]|nr:NADH-quinone oxidoreductase subunit I [Fibrobacteraceae bacterium]